MDEKAAKKTSQPTVALAKMSAQLAEQHQMPKKSVATLLGDFVDMTVSNLKQGNKVRIPGLGTLMVRNRPARMGRNPATGEQIQIKASKKVGFRPAKELKESI